MFRCQTFRSPLAWALMIVAVAAGRLAIADGSLRVIDPAATDNAGRRNGETPLDWNITGQQGPQGTRSLPPKAGLVASSVVVHSEAEPIAHARQGMQQHATWEQVPVAARATIATALGREHPRYAARRAGGTLQLENRQHGLAADFSPRGVEVRSSASRFGLTLRGYGYDEARKPVASAAPTRDENRVEYRRGALTEWYVNGPLGLEQGFTIAKRPGRSNGRPLTLALSLAGDLVPVLDAGERGLALTREGATVLRYTNLAAYDADERELQAWLEVRGGELLIRVDDAGARYPIVVDPFIEQATLTASAALTDSIRISRDGNTIVAGAPLASVGSTLYQGEVFVFVKGATGWVDSTQVATLVASDGSTGDELGFGVDISADGSAIVAIAPAAMIGANRRVGATYVYTRPAGGWTDSMETAKLTISDVALQALHVDRGQNWRTWNVDISGDGNTVVSVIRDLNNTFSFEIICCGRSDPDPAGLAYVFVRPTSDWANASQNATLRVPVNNYDFPDGTHVSLVAGRFGDSLTISDEGSTIVVGAPRDESVTITGGIFHYATPGAAYVYIKPLSGWVDSRPAARLTKDPEDAVNDFGASLSMTRDATTIVVGAPVRLDLGVTQGQGAAYVFVEPFDGWPSVSHSAAKLTAADGSTFDGFGQSISISSDDASTIVVGAPSVGAPSNEGAVFLFERPGLWINSTETSKLTSPNPAPSVLFGAGVALSGDGSALAVVGVSGFSVPAPPYSGVAWVFTHIADSMAPTITLTTPLEGALYAMNQAVTAEYDCQDEVGGSGLASCVGNVAAGAPIDTATLGAHTFTVTASDNARNTNTVTHHFSVVDVTAPTITLTMPPEGAAYLLNQAVTANYECQDEAGGSGLALCMGNVPSGSPIDTVSVGAKSFTVTTADNAGNSVSLSHTYSVIYNFSGFFAPLANLPTLNAMKTGAAVPVTFSLAGNQGLAILEAGYPTSQQIVCDATASVDGVDQTLTAGSSGLSYDPTTDRYTYVWKTEKAWSKTCRQLVLKLEDGTVHRANFKFN